MCGSLLAKGLCFHPEKGTNLGRNFSYLEDSGIYSVCFFPKTRIKYIEHTYISVEGIYGCFRTCLRAILEIIQHQVWLFVISYTVHVPWPLVASPPKTNMAVENPAFEDVLPIEHGDFPVPCLSSGVVGSKWTVIFDSMEFRDQVRGL